ncbi:MAG: dephospho-CoA kinase [Pseudomonadota bacterium]
MASDQATAPPALPALPALRVGLTGGIGSGKSTVARLLAQRGAAVIDADTLSRATTAAGGAAMPRIAEVFGPDFVAPDGALDRGRMRTLAFSDPGARHRLEAIVHPLVHEAVAAQAREADRAGSRCTVFDLPLLVESGHWVGQLDRIVVVDCREATQVQRVAARSQLAADAVLRIIASQASRAARRAAADIVVFNEDCGLDELDTAVGRVARYLGL